MVRHRLSVSTLFKLWGVAVLDLFFVVAYVSIAYLVFTSSLLGDELSTLVGIGFVLFVPGYAFVSALFPERSTRSTGFDVRLITLDGDVDWMERVALSFVTSIVVVTLLSFLLNVSPFGVQPVLFIRALTAFTLSAAVVAALRRLELPPDRRFVLPVASWVAIIRETIWSPKSPLDAAMHVIVIGAIVIAMVSAGYAISVPQSGESFTEFYVGTETESGDFVAGGYPTTLVIGEQRTLVVGVSNQEHRVVDYSLVVLLQRMAPGDDAPRVIVMQVITKQQFGSLAHNETERRQIRFTPELTGEQLRLQFLLYRGPVPATPSADTAYRDLHIWLTVTPAGNESSV